MKRSANYLTLLVFLVIVFIVGGLGGWITSTSVNDWYSTLNKPSFNPPNWIFGPVWTLLYIFIAIAGWLVWGRTSGVARLHAMVFFGAQLVVNLLWSFLFFGFKRLDWAFYEIALLWILIAATMLIFYRHSKVAGLLFAPYLAWVSFAAFLS